MTLRHSRWLPLLLAGVSTLAPFAIDTYLPAFRALGAALQATPLQMQQTLSLYLLAFAVMLLLHGALSDAYGRRAVMLVNLVVFGAASLGCAFCTGIHAFTALRVVQGLCGGAGLVVGRAIIRDLHEGPAAQRMMSQVTLWFALAPAVAPVIGGFLEVHLGWPAIFVFMALVALLLLALCARHLPETLPPPARQAFRPRPLLGAYRTVLGDPVFRWLSLALAGNFAAFFLYIAAAPAFVGGLLHQPETRYAWLFVPGIGGVSLGAWLSGRVAHRWTPARTVRTGFLLMVSAGLANLAGNALAAPALPWAVLPVLVYASGMSLASPTLTLMLLDRFPANRGMAASLQNAGNTFANALVAGALAPWLGQAGVLLAAGMAGLLALGLLGWYRAARLLAH